MRGAIWGTTGASLMQGSFGVRQSHQNHAVMQKWQHHAQERRLLPAVQALGGGEHGRWPAGQRAAGPECASAVQEVLQGRRHIAEARGTSEYEAIRGRQIL